MHNIMTYNITSGALKVTLKHVDAGFALAGVETHGKQLLTLKAEPLFSLTAEKLVGGTKINADSLADFEETTVEQSGNTTTVTCKGCEKLPLVSVKIVLTAVPEQSRIEFESEVLSRNGEYAILSCDYPNLWFNATDGMKFLSPYGCGEAMDADSERFGHGYGSTQDYPSYGVSFQFTTVWDENAGAGVYYGVHDPVPAVKQFSFIRATGAPTMRVNFTALFDRIDLPANGQKLCGKAVWQAVKGDWYDGALLYKEWMEKEAKWKPETGETGRADGEWLNDTDFWWLVHIKDEHFAEPVLQAAKELGVPSAVHLYLWHQNPFDNDYPHYFPEKPFVRAGIKQLQDAGIKVIPYINGRLWDTRDKGIEDYQFTSLAKPSCTKDRTGKPFTESYSAKEENGEHTVLAVMCPSTKLWKDTVKNVVSGLLDDIGFDGVYMDQIAAAKPQMCADPTHGHPAGGGTWWNEAYYDLIRGVNAGHKKERTVFATECTAEMFMKKIQAYLSWLWVKNDQVPAFPVVYTGKVALFGRSYNGLDRAATDIFAAQSLLYGDQMGWISPENFAKIEDKDFFVKLVNVRRQHHALFVSGVMLRPPKLEDDAPRLHSEVVSHAYFKTVDYPAVQGALWQDRGGKRVLFLTNSALQAAAVSGAVGLPDGVYPLFGDLAGQAVEIKNGRFTLKMPPLSVVWAEE